MIVVSSCNVKNVQVSRGVTNPRVKYDERECKCFLSSRQIEAKFVTHCACQNPFVMLAA